jgi:hypothetical protein
MKRLSHLATIGLLASLAGCTASHDVGPGALLAEVEPTASVANVSAACRAELEHSLDGLPNTLGCTGLYASLSQKKVASANKGYAPAHALWSDGAEKSRWLHLPEGKTIDASNPNAWVFPVGTKAWKEFRVQGGRLVETRLYEKTASDRWAKATYEWDEDETEAVRAAGKDIIVGDQPYHLPSGTECDDCHGGRKDRLLGFEQPSLGLDGAQGLTLAALVAAKQITGLKGGTHYEIGDDGTGVAAQALGWMHINCGVSCHNDNPNSKGYARGMRLQLDATQLDGREPGDFQAVTTTVDVDATTMRWAGQKRIVPGSPEESLSYVLMSQRGDKQQQMPPIASLKVDEDSSATVAEWIEKLPKAQ